MSDKRRVRLYDKERAELEAAVGQLKKRARRLTGSDGQPKHSAEEMERRASVMVQQFDLTARKILRKADRDANRQREVIASLEGDALDRDREQAQHRLEAAEVLRRMVLETRKKVTVVDYDPTKRGS